MSNFYPTTEKLNITSKYMQSLRADNSSIAIKEFRDGDGKVYAIGTHLPEVIGKLEALANEVKDGCIYSSCANGIPFDYSVWYFEDLDYSTIKPKVDKLKNKHSITA